MMLETGQILQDRYRIDGLLGRGGMGAVYRGHDLRLDHTVAIKENLEFDRGGSPQTAVASTATTSPEDIEFVQGRRDQFEREAQILARLRHAGLPKVTDHFVVPHHGQYLVMEFIDGKGLDELLKAGQKFEAADAVRIGVEICAVLTYLHNLDPPIIHRDIKPANLRLTPRGRTVLVDFGIAKEGEAGVTRTGALGATPGYSPMEQYAGSGKTDARTDVYALGSTLHTLLGGGSPPSATDRAIGRPVNRLAGIVPGVSHGLQVLIDKSMELIPEDRFQSAQEFRDALEEFLVSREGSSPAQDAGSAGTDPFETMIPEPMAEPTPQDLSSAPSTGSNAPTDDVTTQLPARRSFFDAAEGGAPAGLSDSAPAGEDATTAPGTDPSAYQTQEPPKRRGMFWLWILLIPLIGVGGWLAYQEFGPQTGDDDQVAGTISEDGSAIAKESEGNGENGRGSLQEDDPSVAEETPTSEGTLLPVDTSTLEEFENPVPPTEDTTATIDAEQIEQALDANGDSLAEMVSQLPTETGNAVETPVETVSRLVTLVELHVSDDASFQPSEATLYRAFVEETESYDLYQSLRPNTLLADPLFSARLECGKTYFVKGKARTVEYAERSESGRWDRFETSAVETDPCPEDVAEKAVAENPVVTPTEAEVQTPAETSAKTTTPTKPPVETQTQSQPPPRKVTIPTLDPVRLRAATGVSEDAFLVSWTQSTSTSFRAYDIEISADRGFERGLHEQTLEGAVGQKSVRFEGLECETEYFYRVRVRDTHGQNALSEIGSARTKPCPFPNPVVINLSGTGSFSDLQSAIQAINRDPRAAPMTRIELAPGAYPVNDDLWLGKPIEIQGNRSTLQFTNGRVVLQTENATLRGLTIESATRSAVNVPSGKLTIENCRLRSSKLACLDVYGRGSVEIKDSVIENSPSKGIMVRGQGNVTARGCEIRGNQSGLDVTESGRADLNDCTVTGSLQSGVYIHDGGQANLVGCKILSNGLNGVSIKRNSSVRIERSEISGNQQFGLLLDRTGRATLVGVAVNGNEFGSIDEEAKGSVTADRASRIE